MSSSLNCSICLTQSIHFKYFATTFRVFKHHIELLFDRDTSVLKMSENSNTLLVFLLSVIGYGGIALGIAITYSAWYVGYMPGITIGAVAFIIGILSLLAWYFMKKK